MRYDSLEEEGKKDRILNVLKKIFLLIKYRGWKEEEIVGYNN